MPATVARGLPPTIPTGPSWPTSTSADGRSILDQRGNPWLMLSDQLLPAIHNAGSLANFTQVIQDRSNRQYNAVWICAVTDAYIGALDTFVDWAGNVPFNGAGLSTPNASYWANFDSLISTCQTYGITAIVTPIETAGNAFGLARTAGNAGCFAFGQFLGNRYKSFPNVLWLHGNDFGLSSSWTFAPPSVGDDVLEQNVHLGIVSAGDKHLVTAELNYDLSLCTDDASTQAGGVTGGWQSIVQLTQIYSYYKTYVGGYLGYQRLLSNDSLGHAARFPAMPVFLGEANYEGADNLGGGANPASPYVLRAQEYWTVLAGGLGGQIWGNKILHHFSSGWQSNLNTTGANDAQRWINFFYSYPEWNQLVPDFNNTFVTAGFGTYDTSTTGITPTPGTYCTAAVTADGVLGMCYVPVHTTLTVAMTKMAGTAVATWFDPTNASYHTVGSFANTGTQTFTPPATTNSAGDPDWVLVLTAV